MPFFNEKAEEEFVEVFEGSFADEKEIEFIKSMTEKLKQGDISAKEATYIFLLATVTYATKWAPGLKVST